MRIDAILAKAREREALRRRVLASQQVASMRRRAAFVAAITTVPVVSSTATEKHVLQADFVNVVGSPTGGYVEVQVTRDSDGRMRFHSAATTAPTVDGTAWSGLLATFSGNPAVTLQELFDHLDASFPPP